MQLKCQKTHLKTSNNAEQLVIQFNFSLHDSNVSLIKLRFIIG